MMTDKLRAAALAALETLDCGGRNYSRAAHILRAALAEPEPEQEPVAWMSDCDVGFIKSEFGKYPCVPLYTTPPRKEWVGLTHDERVLITDSSMDDIDVVIRAEAKLREKNT